MGRTEAGADHINDLLGRYRALAPVVDERMRRVLVGEGHPLIHITHRVKTPDSIRGKLSRKPDLYPRADELRDILGFRVICYFQEDIDEVAGRIARAFRVDWGRSKDRRELIDATSFGYLSLHYICALPDDDEFAEDLRGLWFEVQIRTILQHAWAEVEHDLGYKSDFGVPRAVRREFSRAASLLETADDLFSDIRSKLFAYKRDVRERIEADTASELYLDSVTIGEFTARSHAYRRLLDQIAGLTGATVHEASPEGQLPQLAFLGIRTLGDLVDTIGAERDTALALARERLREFELEELSSTVAYYYLMRAVLVDGAHSPERIREFFELTSENERAIQRSVDWILRERASRV